MVRLNTTINRVRKQVEEKHKVHLYLPLFGEKQIRELLKKAKAEDPVKFKEQYDQIVRHAILTVLLEDKDVGALKKRKILGDKN